MNKHMLDCQVSTPKSSTDVSLHFKIETVSGFNQLSLQWAKRAKFAAAWSYDSPILRRRIIRVFFVTTPQFYVCVVYLKIRQLYTFPWDLVVKWCLSQNYFFLSFVLRHHCLYQKELPEDTEYERNYLFCGLNLANSKGWAEAVIFNTASPEFL